MKPSWKTYLLYASLIIVGGGLLFILTETVREENTGFETKTLWDWMELLVIPLTLLIGGYILNRSERDVERQRAEDRANLEREIATDRQREAVLQSYLDRMAELLLKEKLRTTKNKEVKHIARTWTLTVLRGLSPRRKGNVMIFLYEAGLINNDKPIVDLSSADFRYADLILAGLDNANLLGVDLEEANLLGAYLRNTCLQGANLSKANLAGANLTGAILKDAYLENAIISTKQLIAVKSLQGATMPDGTKHD